MRCCRFFAAGVSLLLSLSVAATDAGGAQPGHHRHRSTHRTASDAQRRVATHEIEVRQLQQDVARQELASKQATERLQQQDQAIADLQKQLHEVRSTPAGQH